VSSVVDQLVGLASPWAYVLVGVLALLESAAFIGLFFPGELAVLAGGYVAYQGRASLGVMIVVATVGAIAGDSVGYEIGRTFGGRMRHGRLGAKVGEERWAKGDAYLARRGGRAVFFGRFVGVLRAVVPALAGASHMPYRRFIVWNALGALIWGPSLVLAGFLAGRSYRQVAHYSGRAGLILLALLVVVGGIVAGARWVARHSDETKAVMERFLDRPIPKRLRTRYRRPLHFIVDRFRPSNALGLSLTISLVVLVALGWAFGTVVQGVLGRDELMTTVDGPITRYVVDHRTASMTSMMKAVTMLGSSAVLVPLVVVAGLVARQRRAGWKPLVVLAASLLGSIALYDVVKVLVGRPRPAVGRLVATATGYSFPSGHAVGATAALGALAYLCATWQRGWAAKVATWASAIIVVLLVGFSRVYLGVHWTSDVVGGYALGALWLAAVVTTVSTVGRVRAHAAASREYPARATAGPGRGTAEAATGPD